MENINGAEADLIHRARELTTEGPVTFTWREFLKYAQRGDRGRSAKENARIDRHKKETRTRESHPTLYPAGEVVGENKARKEP
eukprot:6126475-Pleurochrysis_carterae.AAC.1